MRKQSFKGTGDVFRFSLRQQTGRPGWWVGTLLPALLLLVGIIAALLISAATGEKKVTATAIHTVYIADETNLLCDYSALSLLGDEVYSDIHYAEMPDAEAALDAARKEPDALVLTVSFEESMYSLRIIRPEGSAISRRDASDFGDFLTGHFTVLSIQKSGLSPEQIVALGAGVLSEASTSEAYREGRERSGFEVTREIMEMVLPYLGIMLLYFLVLIYGQGVAGSVILEKTNKLMDTMLLSLPPEAMILGKTLAAWLAGVVQLMTWIVGAVLGCVLGRGLVNAFFPGSNLGIFQFFDLLGSASGLFTLPGVILAALLILAGFLMYCAIASIGGALASKPEDLGSCNSIFTLLLVASFLLTIYGENSGGSMSMVSTAAWMNYLPFTAVMCTPARVLLGSVGIPTALISLALILAVTLLAVYVAGRVYRLLIFRRGDPPRVTDIPKLLKQG